MTQDPEQRPGQHRLDEDVQVASARHADAEHLVVEVEPEQPWTRVGERGQRLVPHGRLGTASANPAE
jgi:hypothetical protein